MRLAVLLALTCLALAGCSTTDQADSRPRPDSSHTTRQPSDHDPSRLTPTATRGPVRPRVVRTIATDLQVPWGLTFLPDGTALVGERDTTRVLAISDGRVREVGRVEAAAPQGEAGLLGLAASPSYPSDHLVFAYVSTTTDNRVVRMRYADGRLGAPVPVLTGIPNGFTHDGGRLLFAPDGNLFVSTGEAGLPELAQDPHSLGGKILRITPAGDPAPGNPTPGSPVWTLGHRNVQGLAFDDRGRLWATEFGQDTWDELNLIRRGDNYGWPLIEGRGHRSGYRDPVVTWDTEEASPSGLAYLDGSLWAGALRGARLWQIPMTRNGVRRPRPWFVGDFGRIRTVAVAPDGNLWITTSNRDGRAAPAPDDDRIIEVALR